MQFRSDRIGRRMKLHDLHVLMAVVQAGSMEKAASISQYRPSPSFPDRSRNWNMCSACVCSTATAQGVEPTIYGRGVARMAEPPSSTNCAKA